MHGSNFFLFPKPMHLENFLALWRPWPRIFGTMSISFPIDSIVSIPLQSSIHLTTNPYYLHHIKFPRYEHFDHRSDWLGLVKVYVHLLHQFKYLIQFLFFVHFLWAKGNDWNITSNAFIIDLQQVESSVAALIRDLIHSSTYND